MGQPSKLDDLRAKRIVDAIAKGMSRTASAAAARVSRQTLMNWLARGRDGEAPYVDFFDRVKRAEAEAEELMVTYVRTAASEPRYWQAAAWWLERCRPADYAKREATVEDATERAEGTEHSIETVRSILAALESRKAG